MVHERVEEQHLRRALERELGATEVVVGVADREHDRVAAEDMLERDAAQAEPEYDHDGQQRRRQDPVHRASSPSETGMKKAP